MTIIDIHIHIHECYNLENFFNSAENNFRKQANKLNASVFIGVLGLTEITGVNVFEKLQNTAERKEKIGDWQGELTNEINSVLFRKDNFLLFLIAGRQIVTKENLEVLSFGLKEANIDGKPVDDIIKFVVEHGSIPIIPWGFGKWIGNRKKILENLILNNEYFPIFLGDNGNRTWILQKSKLFKIAQRKNIFNLPGSDPLPFIREEQKPGSFGFYIEDIIDRYRPFASIYNFLTTTKSQVNTYGKLETTFYFIKNQISMQLVKRNRKI